MTGEKPKIIQLLIMLTRRATFFAQTSFEGKEISYTQSCILTELYRMGGEATQSQIAIQTYLDKSVISRQVTNLEQGAFLERITDHDTREKKIRLLPRGRKRAEETFDNLKLTQTIATETMTEFDKQNLLRYLRLFYKNNAETEEQVLQTDIFCREDWPMITHYVIALGKWLDQEGLRYKKMDGLPSAMKFILLRLYQTKTEIPFKNLEYIAAMEQSGTVKLIKRLEQSGLITITVDPSDKRRKNAIITDAGIIRAQLYLERFAKAEQLGCQGLTPPEREDFVRLIYLYENNAYKFFFGREEDVFLGDRNGF